MTYPPPMEQNGLVERLRDQARYEARANNSIKYPPGTQRAEDRQAWKDADEIEQHRNEIARLRGAVQWALGEKADANGRTFGEWLPDMKTRPLYWWRTQLREMAGL